MPVSTTHVLSGSHYTHATGEELDAARAAIPQEAFNRVFEMLYQHRVRRLAAEAAAQDGEPEKVTA
jgi:hypothetical protein